MLATLVYIYVLFSPPFVFSEYIPFSVRVGLEVIPMIILTLVLSSPKSHLFLVQYIFVWFMLIFMTFLNSENALVSLAYSFFKLLFLFIMLAIFDRSNTLLRVLKKLWFGLWFFIAVSVVLGFLAYQFDVVDFAYSALDDDRDGTTYHYFHNVFFGNFIESYILGVPIPRMCWYVFEPGILAFFLGLNILVSDSLFLRFKHATAFKWLNLVAALLTFSTTFYIFIGLYLIVKILSMGTFKRITLLAVPFFIIMFSWYVYDILMDSDIGESTSFGDRLLRLEAAYYFLENNSLLTFLFGNGLGVSATIFGKGIASGILTIIVERGFLVFSFLMFVIYKYTKHNKVLLFYILFYSLAFELVWHSSFLLLIAIAYSSLHFKSGFIEQRERSQRNMSANV